jgi:hypothetical protein
MMLKKYSYPWQALTMAYKKDSNTKIYESGRYKRNS